MELDMAPEPKQVAAAMSKPCTVIDVIGADHLPGKLVHQVIFFVQALGRC
jgi:hypothetical protein